MSKALRVAGIFMLVIPVFLGWVAHTVSAEGPVSQDSPLAASTLGSPIAIIPGHTAQWVRFDYSFQPSQSPRPTVTVRLLNGAQNGLAFEIWSPERMQGNWMNNVPVGRGLAEVLVNCSLPGPDNARNKCTTNDLVWVGAFGAPGAYYVRIVNNGDSAAAALLVFSGPGLGMCVNPSPDSGSGPSRVPGAGEGLSYALCQYPYQIPAPQQVLGQAATPVATAVTPATPGTTTATATSVLTATVAATPATVTSTATPATTVTVAVPSPAATASPSATIAAIPTPAATATVAVPVATAAATQAATGVPSTVVTTATAKPVATTPVVPTSAPAPGSATAVPIATSIPTAVATSAATATRAATAAPTAATTPAAVTQAATTVPTVAPTPMSTPVPSPTASRAATSTVPTSAPTQAAASGVAPTAPSATNAPTQAAASGVTPTAPSATSAPTQAAASGVAPTAPSTTGGLTGTAPAASNAQNQATVDITINGSGQVSLGGMSLDALGVGPIGPQGVQIVKDLGNAHLAVQGEAITADVHDGIPLLKMAWNPSSRQVMADLAAQFGYKLTPEAMARVEEWITSSNLDVMARFSNDPSKPVVLKLPKPILVDIGQDGKISVEKMPLGTSIDAVAVQLIKLTGARNALACWNKGAIDIQVDGRQLPQIVLNAKGLGFVTRLLGMNVDAYLDQLFNDLMGVDVGLPGGTHQSGAVCK